MELRKFDVTFHLYTPTGMLFMNSTRTVEARTQRLVDLGAAIYASVQEQFPNSSVKTLYPNLNILYVYAHHFDDMSYTELKPYQEGQYTARNGPGGVMENPYVHAGIQQPEADLWHAGYTDELARMQGEKK